MIMRLMPTPDVHPHPDSWHPAGTAVCQNLFNTLFTHYYSVCIGEGLLFENEIPIIEYTGERVLCCVR